jgi:cytochrome c oxidase assembly protein subunit 11
MLSRNARVVLICTGMVAGMAGLAYASVPLYRLFCNATGFNGTTQRVVAPSAQVLDRKVLVRFDSNVAPGLDWEIAPEHNTMQLRIGENALAIFKVRNRSAHVTVGTATFNVTPEQAGGFFNKVQCFCFTEQRLEPGETVEMPVSFYVDPAIVNDPDGQHVNSITLSYTFHPVAKPKPETLAARRVAPAPVDVGVPQAREPKG